MPYIEVLLFYAFVLTAEEREVDISFRMEPEVFEQA